MSQLIQAIQLTDCFFMVGESEPDYPVLNVHVVERSYLIP